MILSDINHQATILRGIAGDLMQEYAGLSCSLLYSEPEIYIAIQTALADDSMELLPQVDRDKLAYWLEHAKIFIEENKKAGTWK